MQVTKRGYGKINISLDVLGRREDGYHLLSMIMESVRIWDRIILTSRDDTGDQSQFSLTTYDRMNKQELGKEPIYQICEPCAMEDNLVYLGAKGILEMYQKLPESRKKAGFDPKDMVYDLVVYKDLPVAAGMAGGSADGAGAILAMNELLGNPFHQEELLDFGLSLGADVPYCILAGSYLAEGIGEKLTKLPPMPKAYVLLAKPPIAVSTKLVYQAVDAEKNIKHPDNKKVIEAMKAGDLKGMANYAGNVLSLVTPKEYPVVEEVRKAMLEEGAMLSLMTGSGPTVFGLYEKEEEAMACGRKIGKKFELEFLQVTTCL